MKVQSEHAHDDMGLPRSRGKARLKADSKERVEESGVREAAKTFKRVCRLREGGVKVAGKHG